MFRRRRHVALTERGSPGVDEQPFRLPEHGVQPERVPVSPRVALLRYDTPPWLAEQALLQWRPVGSQAPSPLPDVSTQEVLDALGTPFSPNELDWELVGVTFVDASLHATEPAPVAAMLGEPPFHAEAQPIPPTRARGKRRKWLREHDEIMAAVRDLSWEGYRSLIADIFRRDGYEVFGGEGFDGDVIDMEVVRGAERMLVNCQLRGLSQIGVEPLDEMAQVARRNGADGVFIISDGDFAPAAWSLADGLALVLIDRENLLGLVLDLTLGAGRRHFKRRS